MSLKRRLKRLQDAQDDAEREPPWSPPETYARIRDDAREDIARAQAEGVEPLYWIDAAGIIRATSDGRPVRHGSDYGAVLDERIRELDAEIAEIEARMTPQELAESRREQAKRDADFEARAAGLGLDEKIALLGADIARDAAEIARLDAEIAAREAEEPG